MAPGLSATWKTMTREEQEEATEDVRKSLEVRRERKKTAAHSVPMGVFNDVKATMTHVETEVRPNHHIF